MITISNLTRYYGDFLAVDHISFEVEKGEILGFLGPNGAGKTTTMKILTGYMLPTEGQIKVDQLDVVNDSMAVRKRIGYLPEQNALYHDMGVLEYLFFVMEARNVPKNEQKKNLSYVIEVCGLTSMLNKNIGELSKGFRQRVGLAQSLIHHPDILVLDEPTVGLDPNQIVEIRNLIKQIGKGKTILLSTHILPEVEVTCDRVVIINSGKIAAIGTTEDLQKNFKGRDKIELVLKGNQSHLFNEIVNIESVEQCQVSHNSLQTSFIMEIEKGKDGREYIYEFVKNQNLPLLELKRDQVSLEDVFRDLTITEQQS